MSENINENIDKNNGQIPDENEDMDYFRNLAQGIIKKESDIDLSSIMQMATSLFNNNTLMNSVVELNKKYEIPESSQKQENAEHTSLSRILEKLDNNLFELKQNSSEIASLAKQLKEQTNAISELKKELQNIKEQNEYLTIKRQKKREP